MGGIWIHTEGVEGLSWKITRIEALKDSHICKITIVTWLDVVPLVLLMARSPFLAYQRPFLHQGSTKISILALRMLCTNSHGIWILKYINVYQIDFCKFKVSRRLFFLFTNCTTKLGTLELSKEAAQMATVGHPSPTRSENSAYSYHPNTANSKGVKDDTWCTDSGML